MKNKLILTMDLLPKGAWGNNLSLTLNKKDWDVLRYECYKRASYRCSICGETDSGLDAHEEWDFDITSKTQILRDIVALCKACHRVKHINQSTRIGYEENAKRHFMRINKCDELLYAKHYLDSQALYDERNIIERWSIRADLSRFGGDGIDIVVRDIPRISNPYEGVRLKTINNRIVEENLDVPNRTVTCPKIRELAVDNYQGIITIVCEFVNKIEWYLDGKMIKRKYNIVGLLRAEFSVEGLEGSCLQFRLVGGGGEIISECFLLTKQT